MKISNLIKPVIGLGVSALFIWLIVRTMPLADLGDAIANVKYEWLAIAVGLFIAGYVFRIQRWKSMLRLENPKIRWSVCAVPFFASIAANNVLPLRAGDALRAVSFSKWLGVSTPGVLASMLVERMLDFLFLLLALGLTLTLLDLDDTVLGTLLGTSATLLITIACLLALFLLRPQIFEPIARWCARLAGRFASNIETMLMGVLDQIFGTLRALAHGPKVLVLFFWSLLAWGCEAAVFYSVARSVMEIANPLAGWLSMPVGTLSTLLPSTPGYVGTFHYFVIGASEALGNTAPASAAFAILVHAVIWSTATIIGGICFIYWLQFRALQIKPSQESASKDVS